MNYAGVIFNDVANGIGFRTSLFVSGCRNNCEGCFNLEAQSFTYGDVFDEDVKEKILESLDDDNIDGLTILGGDPMEPENADDLLDFVEYIKENYKNKTIWLYTGYLYEDLIRYEDSRTKLLKLCDVVVDGPYVEQLKSYNFKFRGSSNQRLIDMNKTRDMYNYIELYII